MYQSIYPYKLFSYISLILDFILVADEVHSGVYSLFVTGQSHHQFTHAQGRTDSSAEKIQHES